MPRTDATFQTPGVYHCIILLRASKQLMIAFRMIELNLWAITQRSAKHVKNFRCISHPRALVIHLLESSDIFTNSK